MQNKIRQKQTFLAKKVVFHSNPPTFLKITLFNPSGALTIFYLLNYELTFPVDTYGSEISAPASLVYMSFNHSNYP